MAEQQKPSVGRIVHVDDHGDTRPAIVVGVRSDGSLDLTVFRPYGETMALAGAKQGESNGQWRWPERV